MTRTEGAAARREAESHLPLTPATFQILLALVDGERHGYAIMREVADQPEGTGGVRLGPGTLYGSLKRLLEAGLVEEGAERTDPELGDERRRYYRITKSGLSVARAEARRLAGLVRAARHKKLIGLEPA
jgi:DNA-binding PadR family transcriptional regulator